MLFIGQTERVSVERVVMGSAAESRSEWFTGVEAQDLRSYFRDHEAAIGFRSTFSAMLAALEGVAMGSGPPDGWDPHFERLDREWKKQREEKKPLISKDLRIWRRLRAMDTAGHGKEIIVLFRMYGAVKLPTGYASAFGEDAACLASLTEAAEEARTALALKAGQERESAVRLRCVGAKDEGEATFWRIAPRWEALAKEWEKLRLKAKESPAKAEELAPRLAGLSEERKGLRKTLDRASRAKPVPGSDAAISALTSCDMEATIELAIERRLSDTNEPRRNSFVVAVKNESRQMALRAHTLYRATRGAS